MDERRARWTAGCGAGLGLVLAAVGWMALAARDSAGNPPPHVWEQMASGDPESAMNPPPDAGDTASSAAAAEASGTAASGDPPSNGGSGGSSGDPAASGQPLSIAGQNAKDVKDVKGEGDKRDKSGKGDKSSKDGKSAKSGKKGGKKGGGKGDPSAKSGDASAPIKLNAGQDNDTGGKGDKASKSGKGGDKKTDKKDKNKGESKGGKRDGKGDGKSGDKAGKSDKADKSGTPVPPPAGKTPVTKPPVAKAPAVKPTQPYKPVVPPPAGGNFETGTATHVTNTGDLGAGMTEIETVNLDTGETTRTSGTMSGGDGGATSTPAGAASSTPSQPPTVRPPTSVNRVPTPSSQPRGVPSTPSQAQPRPGQGSPSDSRSLPSRDSNQGAKGGAPGNAIHIPGDPDGPPAEERMYSFISIRNGTYEDVLEMFAMQSGLTIIGDVPRGPVTVVPSDRELTYVEALRRIRTLLFKFRPLEPWWALRDGENLEVMRFADVYRRLQDSDMYRSVEAFQAANLHDEDAAFLAYTPPYGSVSDLEMLRDFMPDYVRAAPAGEETNTMGIFALVKDIRKYISLVEFFLGDKNDPRIRERIMCQYVLPSQAIATLEILLGDREGGRGGGGQPSAPRPPSAQPRGTNVGRIPEPEVTMVPFDEHKELYVKAMPAKIKEIKELMPLIDRPLPEMTPVVIKLQFADADELANLIRQILVSEPEAPSTAGAGSPSRAVQIAKQGRGILSAGNISIIPSPQTNELIVVADVEGVARVRRLVEMFDKDSPTGPYKIDLMYVSAMQVATTINQVMGGGRAAQPGGVPSAPSRCIADAGDAAVWIDGSLQDIARMREMIAAMDVQQADVSLHIVRLENQMPSFMVTLLQQFESAAPGGTVKAPGKAPTVSRTPRSAAKFTPDDINGRLFVLCTDEEWKQYEPIIQQADEIKAESFVRFEVTHIDPDEAISTIMTLMPPGAAKGGKAARYHPTHDGIIVFGASESEVSDIRKLLAAIDQPKGLVQKTFEIQYADPSDLVDIIEALVLGGAGPKAGPQPRSAPGRAGAASADEPTVVPFGRNLVVRADPETMGRIAAIIIEFDVESDVSETRVYKFPEGVDVDTVASTLPEMLPGEAHARAPKGGPQPAGGGLSVGPQFIPLAAANKLIVVAAKTLFPRIEAAIEILKAEPTEGGQMRTVALKKADAGEMVKVIQQMMAVRTGGRGAPGKGRPDGGMTPFTAIEQPGGGGVVLNGMPADVEVAAQWVTELDEAAATGQQIKIYQIEVADVEQLVNIIMNVVDTGAKAGPKAPGGQNRKNDEEEDEFDLFETNIERVGKDVYLQADLINNTIMVATTPAKIEQIDGIVAQFDHVPEEGEIGWNPIVELPSQIYPLKHVGAWEAVDLLESLLDVLWTPSNELPVVDYIWGTDILVIKYPKADRIPEVIKIIEEYVDKPVEGSTLKIIRPIQVPSQFSAKQAAELLKSHATREVVLQAVGKANVEDEGLVERIVPRGRTAPAGTNDKPPAEGETKKENGGGEANPVSTQGGEPSGSGNGGGNENGNDNASAGGGSPGCVLPAALSRLPEFTIASALGQTAKRGQKGDKDKSARIKGGKGGRDKSAPAPAPPPGGKPGKDDDAGRAKGGAGSGDDVIPMTPSHRGDAAPGAGAGGVKLQGKDGKAKEAKDKGGDGAGAAGEPGKTGRGEEPAPQPGGAKHPGDAHAPKPDGSGKMSAPSHAELMNALSNKPSAGLPQESSEKPQPSAGGAAPHTPAPSSEGPFMSAPPVFGGGDQPAPGIAVVPPPGDAGDPSAEPEEGAVAEPVKIYYDEVNNVIMVEGLSGDVDEIEEILKELMEGQPPTKPDIRVYRVKFIDPVMAKEIIEEMFNTPKAEAAQIRQQQAQIQAQQRAQQQAQQRAQQQQQQQQGRGGKEEDEKEGQTGQPGQPGQQPGQPGQQPQIPQMPQITTSVRVYPNPRDRTLIIRANTGDYPFILDLLATIDQPQQAKHEIRTYELDKLDAVDVAEKLRALLGIEDKPMSPEQKLKLAESTGFILPQLITTKEGHEITPSDIKISSNPLANTVIAMAPVEALDYIGMVIKDMEAFELPERKVEWLALNHAVAADLIPVLEVQFKEERRAPGGAPGQPAKGRGAGGAAEQPPTFTAYPRLNQVIIRGTDEQIEETKEMLLRLDVQADDSAFDFVPLSCSDAEEVARLLGQMYAGSAKAKGAGRGGEGPKFIGETSSNTLFYSAPKSMHEEILGTIDRIETETCAGGKPRIIELQIAKPSEIAEAVMMAYTGAGKSKSRGGAGGGKGRLSVAGHDPTHQLFVVAPDEETFNEIKALVEKLDKPREMPEFKIYPLQYANARAVLDRIKAMMTDYFRNKAMGGGGRGGGLEGFAVDADDATNSLIVLGNAEIFAFVEESLKKVDSPVFTAGEIIVKMYQLTHANAVDLAKNIADMYEKKGRGTGGAPAPIVEANKDLNVLIVRGTQKQQDEIYAQYIEPIDGMKPPSLRSETINLKIGNPNVISELVRAMMTERVEALKKTRKGGNELDTTFAIIPDVDNRQILVLASEENFQFIRERIELLDNERAVADAQLETRAYQLNYADPATVKEIIEQWSQDRRGGGSKRGGAGAGGGGVIAARDIVNVVVDAATQRLVVTASQENHDRIGLLLQTVDQASSAERTMHVVNLKFASAEELGKNLQNVMRSTQQRKRGEMVQMTIQPDAATNSLLVFANDEEMEKLSNLLSVLDVEEVQGDKVIESIPLQFADPWSVNGAIDAIFRQERGKQMNPRDQVISYPEWGSQSIIVATSKQQMEKVKAFIESLDQAGANDNPIEVVEIKHADAGAISRALQELFRQRGNRQGIPQMVITNPPGSNQIVIRANKSEADDIKQTIAQMDIDPGLGGEVRIFSLTYVQAAEAERALTDYLRQSGGGGRGGGGQSLAGNARISAMQSANALLVTAEPTTMERIAAIIADMDQAGEGMKETRVVKLQHVKVADIEQAVADLFAGGQRGRGAGPAPVVVPSDLINGFVFRGSEADFATLEELVKMLDSEDVTPAEIHVIELKLANGQDVARMLQEMYARSGGRRGGGGESNVVVSNPRGTNTLIIKAGVDDFAEMQAIIQQMDAATAETVVRIFPLDRIPSSEAEEVLNDYLRKPGAGGGRGAELMGDVRISAMPSSNSLVVTAKPDDMDRIAGLVTQLNEGDISNPAVIIPLRYVSVGQVLPTLEQMFVDNRQSRSRDAGPPPVIVGNDSAKALIVKASRSDLAEIKDTIAQLDREDFAEQQGFRLIEVPPGINVEDLSAQVERAVNEGARAQATMQGGRRPASVTVLPDLRTNSLLVTGVPSLFDQVEKTVRQLVEMGPAGAPTIKIIRLDNSDPEELKRLIEELSQRSSQSRGMPVRRR